MDKGHVDLTPDTPTPTQGQPAIKGLIMALIGGVTLHWAGTSIPLGAVAGFLFFLIGHVNGHAFGYKLGREEKAKELASSQPEISGDVDVGGDVDGERHLG